MDTNLPFCNSLSFKAFYVFVVIMCLNDMIFVTEKLEDLYAFSYSPQSEKLTRSAGWALFDIKSEYARMGVPSELWTATTTNRGYKV